MSSTRRNPSTLYSGSESFNLIHYPTKNLEDGFEVESHSPTTKEIDEWLPKVHTAIANFKHCLLGPFHGLSSPKPQKYLAEFVYRYNWRFWKSPVTASPPDGVRKPVSCSVEDPVCRKWAVIAK